ncbi:MAG: hypothetical protein NTV29_05765 [Planctomycetota bacterium]|nr:hypothetical protein [Planctomycetota bacterium]
MTKTSLTKLLKRGILAAILISTGRSTGYSQDGNSQESTAVPAEQISSREGAWEFSRGRITTARRTVTLAPKAEHKPALSIRFIPDSFNAKLGNAAIYYLKAGGFFEQTAALQAKQKFEVDSRAAAGDREFAPFIWLETELKDLPVEKVKEYLVYTSFQPLFLEEAASRLHCDFDRQIKSVENPVGYLLPEVQAIRDVARIQAMRFLVAMAENRPDDAVKILGQLIAMGPHLCQEPFLVSNLVGTACVNIGLQQAYYLSEHADAPNLYWAIAQLPKPLIQMDQSLAYEREFLFEQVKALREVDSIPKPDGYWSEFIDRFTAAMKGIGSPFDQSEAIGKAGITLAIGSNVPKAREYLVEIEGMSHDTLDKLPNAQIFFLAVRRFYERYRDEEFKVSFLPEHARNKARVTSKEFGEFGLRYGLITLPTSVFLPAVQAAQGASLRTQQQLALWQTVEALRNHLATHDNKLPATLEELELPAPHDPLTNGPFEYIAHAAGATLKGAEHPGLQYQLELRTKPINP